jgi:hypothetical protein
MKAPPATAGLFDDRWWRRQCRFKAIAAILPACQKGREMRLMAQSGDERIL